MKQVSAIVIGAGARGQVYAKYAAEHPDRLRILAVAEPKQDRRELFCRAYGIPPELAFTSWEELLARPQMADAALICTLDDMHTDPALAALRQGYHILLEKPMSNKEAECRAIARAAEESGRIRKYLSKFHKMGKTGKRLSPPQRCFGAKTTRRSKPRPFHLIVFKM